ncbi:hypothetical protein OKA04_17085 [Luteolibacter flavescens]|uniref:Uncharacterized protein n=1 Tax=Luteolibacter flavescens TaxID=1859460 RepID=A0ABT3FS93_9BACT|nr:hypothetical protein [Luteolibacter flavescens]MCW1886456.1 hypothetical protein [Luteolibacter flavescens]
MKTIAFLTLLVSGTAAFAAGPPVKKPVSSYMHLSQNSPFTTKPVIEPPIRVDTTFDDWSLGGVSEVEGGYMVTLVHKKNQGETQVIRPRGTVHKLKDEMKWIEPGATDNFKVDRVTYGKTSWKDTTVQVSIGGKTGTMKFDDKQLTPTASAAPAPGRPGMPGQPQQGIPGQPPQPGAVHQQPGQQTQQDGQRGSQRRPRVLPPTQNNPQPQGQGRNR